MDKNLKAAIIIDRAITIIASNLVLSVIVAVIDYFVAEMTGYGTLAMVGLAMLVFFAFNVLHLRWSYIDAAGDYKVYLGINLFAYLTFAVINIICALVIPGGVYTWGFVMTKFFKLLAAVCISGLPEIIYKSNVLSAILFHIIGVLCVVIAPIGVKIVLLEEPKMPPMLEIPDENAKNEENTESEAAQE